MDEQPGRDVTASSITRRRTAHRVSVGATAAVAAGVVATGTWSWSWPGVPSAGAVVTVLGAALLLVLLARLSARAVAVGAVLLLLGAVLAATAGSAGAPLRFRWAVSAAAFQAEVARVRSPGVTTDGPGSFADYPAECPERLGSFPLEDCAAIDGGYLYLQQWEAVTDSSGIAYLPTGTDHPGLESEEWIPLGGPWYAWTCHC